VSSVTGIEGAAFKEVTVMSFSFRHSARRLLLIPMLITAFAVASVPAQAASGTGTTHSAKGLSKRPAGTGSGRRI
jgi:hypothetical protein